MSDIVPNCSRRSLLIAVVLVAGLATSLQSCSDALQQIGPSIDRLTLTPSAVPKQDTGMTDEYIGAEIVVSGFESQLEDATIFVQTPGGREPAQYNSSVRSIQEGDNQTTIVIEDRNGGIQKSWLRDLQPGTYDVGATVVSADAEVTKLNLTQVSVCQDANSGPCA
ncbi:MAG: hypothetical protein ABEL76_12400 [Bradymonadaceae bacterium]